MATLPPPVADDALARHERRAAALSEVLAAPEGAAPLRIDTHVSTVLVARTRAFKLKRPVRLPFVDLTDAAERRALCRDEVRLNRRLAAALYLGVVAVLGPPERPVLGPLRDPGDAALDEGPEAGAELAVVMHAFEQRALWSRRVPAGEVDAAEARALGAAIGEFHRDRAPPRPGSPHGSAAAFATRVRENFASLRAQVGAAHGALIDRLERDAAARHDRLAALRDARNRLGFVREGHGDLHLANVATIDGAAVPFDCLEFDEGLRTADVADELAFPTMDLQHAGRPDLAHALLDGWLEATGDFEALALLDDGCAYRATVRAKVAALDAAAHPAGDGLARCAAYLRTADAFGARPPPVLVATHGLSGSGKSVVSAVLAAEIGAARLRTDLERKRAAGLAPESRDAAHGPLYGPGARDSVYARIADLAAGLLALGWPVVVDATCLARAQRRRLAEVAAAAGVPFVLLDLQAPEAVLRERIAARAAAGRDPSDADLAVLDAQLRAREPLDADERSIALAWDATREPTREAVAGAWRAHLAGRAYLAGRAHLAASAARGGSR
jgi:aminoglycoside phosphotransferase family enzyme/predicted kinase